MKFWSLSQVGISLLILLCSQASTAKRITHPCQEQQLSSQVVCHNKGLLTLDRKQQQHAQQLMRNMSMHRRALFMDEQNKWYALRNQCGNSASCLENMYILRQHILNEESQYSMLRSAF